MAKTKHNNLIDTIDDIITNAKQQGIVHLYTEDDSFTGRTVKIKNKDLYHFGTTGYLGLEQDERLKKAAIDAINRFGTQFPLSKTYISHSLYSELEAALQEMYGMPVIVCKNSTLAHIAVIPSLVRDEDVVVLDHQVHASVQNACQLLKPRNIPVDMIRHSNMEMLETKIKSYGNKYKKIYYMADGVYSMYGDCVPLQDLFYLMEKYPALHIYVDDVHGMSWSGKHGTGYIKSQAPDLHPRMILISTLSKTFGASGGTVVIPDQEIYRKIKTFGGPLTFSAQLEPAAVGAAVASAKIHLTDEIYEMQDDLMKKVQYCNSLLRETDVPIVEENNCPVFYIGTGLPSTGYNFISRMMNEGFFVNLGIFPAVPIKNTGIRFTISRHNRLEDIKKLVDAIAYHYPKALEEEGQTIESVKKAFRIEEKAKDIHNDIHIHSSDTILEHFTTIKDVKQAEWDALLGGAGLFDYNGMSTLEEAFTSNEAPEHNWKFHYIIVRDRSYKPVLATFFTCALWKDDMLSPYNVSVKIEEKRKEDPYYLTSRFLCMGSLISEGDHLYLDKKHPSWDKALIHMLQYISILQENEKAAGIVLRDFDTSDHDLKNIFLQQGYFPVTMPEACTLREINFTNVDEYLQTLSSKSRQHVRNDVIKNLDKVEVEFKKSLSLPELEQFYKLYLEVADRNFDLNYFEYPFKFLEEVNGKGSWEFIVISLKGMPEKPVCISLTYKNAHNNFTGVILGMDYTYLTEIRLYKQILFHTVMRAQQLKCNKVYLGFSASTEKKKFGATIIPKVAYMQTRDNFKLELLETINAAS